MYGFPEDIIYILIKQYYTLPSNPFRKRDPNGLRSHHQKLEMGMYYLQYIHIMGVLSIQNNISWKHSNDSSYHNLLQPRGTP